MHAHGDARAGLYVHVPFCRSICPYCDFAVTLAGEARRASYVAALEREARSWGQRWSHPFDTVYFGGGTPSNLSTDGLASIVDALRTDLPVAPDAHWVLEANPDDVHRQSAADWVALGFRGVSLGVQSFDPAGLDQLGRTHSVSSLERVVDDLRSAGFDWISADLIFGRPDQDVAAWSRDLDAAASLPLDHVSCYQLTIHPDTVFGRRQEKGALFEAGEDIQREQFVRAHERLTGAGFEHYEVSNYARPGRRSIHNQKYWQHLPYLGLGPSAHSYDGGRRRWWNIRKPRLWERAVMGGGDGVENQEVLADEDLAVERAMLGLRTSDGLDIQSMDRLVGGDLVAANRLLLERWETADLVRLNDGRLQPTARGMAVADGLVRDLRLD
jgi:oxygen-independent coproporphyrinogen-3 oxidase